MVKENESRSVKELESELLPIKVMKRFKLHSRFARIYCGRSDLSRFPFFEGLHKLKDLSELKTVTFQLNDFAPDIKYISAECISRNPSCNLSRKILELS